MEKVLLCIATLILCTNVFAKKPEISCPTPFQLYKFKFSNAYEGDVIWGKWHYYGVSNASTPFRANGVNWYSDIGVSAGSESAAIARGNGLMKKISTPGKPSLYAGRYYCHYYDVKDDTNQPLSLYA